jgi:HSP20 family protein
MTLTRPEPAFSPIKDVERLFERFFARPSWPLGGTVSRENVWEPSLDFAENSKEFVVLLEIPGVTRDDLDVKLEGNLLTLSGKRELNKQEKGDDYLWEERVEGRFARTLRVPSAVQESEIEATYNDGVLTVRLPKSEPQVKNKITIK